MKRNTQLDALRGLAALFVLASHAGGALDARFLGVMLHTFDLGHVGVIVFFLISGRIIPQSVKHGPRVFLVRRFFRLYPLYWVNLALIGGAPLVLLANATMLPSLFDAPALNSGVWTLAVELTFYVSVLVCRRFPPWLPCIVFALGSLLLPWLFYLAVCWAGAAWEGPHAFLCGALVVALTFAPHFLIYEIAHVLPRILGFAIVLLWRWAPCPLVWIGERSYALYLMHPLVLAWLPPLLWLPGVAVVSAASYRLIERPAIALGKRAASAHTTKAA